jgi:hypothetical protein
MITKSTISNLGKSSQPIKAEKGVSEFMGYLLSSVSSAHITHTYQKDRALSTHLTLSDYYTGLDDLADDFIESYQGLHGQVDFMVEGKRFDQPESCIKECYDYIEKTRSMFKESFLQNIIDEIQELHAKTLYKLKFVC